MNDLKNKVNTIDNSFLSKETEVSSSFENQSLDSIDLENIIIDSIVSNLEDIIKDNKSRAKHPKQDIFYLSFIPPISLNEYIKQIMEQTKMDISTLIISIIYIDRFCHKNKYILTMNNIYRILLYTILLSIKFNQDKTICNKRYSKIACVSIEDLNTLEFTMYLKLHFSLKVKDELYLNYHDYFSNYLHKKTL